MIEARDGYAIALARIAEEAERRTGRLDLGGLGLRELPPQLFELTELRELNLGSRFVLREGGWVPRSYREGPPLDNLVQAQCTLLAWLPELQWLSLAGTDLTDSTSLAALHTLRDLDMDTAMPVTRPRARSA